MEPSLLCFLKKETKSLVEKDNIIASAANVIANMVAATAIIATIDELSDPAKRLPFCLSIIKEINRRSEAIKSTEITSLFQPYFLIS